MKRIEGYVLYTKIPQKDDVMKKGRAMQKCANAQVHWTRSSAQVIGRKFTLGPALWLWLLSVNRAQVVEAQLRPFAGGPNYGTGSTAVQERDGGVPMNADFRSHRVFLLAGKEVLSNVDVFLVSRDCGTVEGTGV